MPCGSVFTFTWNRAMKDEIRKYESPIFEDEILKGTKWHLTIGNYWFSTELNLYRSGLDEDGKESISVTFIIELINFKGNILKHDINNDCTFSRGYESVSFSKEIRIEDVFAVRCRIINENVKKQALKWEVPTTIHTQWKINTPNSSRWLKKIQFPFHECTHDGIIVSASDERISINIEKMELPQPYKLKIAVLNDEGREKDLKDSKNVFQSTDENQKLETWIDKSQLVDESRFHLPYSFTLICIISTSNSSYSESRWLGNPVEESLPLKEDLKEMLLKEKHSDVKLRSHDKIIPAHKCLLSVRSPVFSAMFDQDMLETQTGIVDMPDVESETLAAFIEFLYTDAITITDCDEVLKLMLVADQYQVDTLKERCSVILMSKLSLENVCEVISVAEMVNHANLKQCAFEYIKENKKDIISSPAWSELVIQNMNLSVQILSKLIID